MKLKLKKGSDVKQPDLFDLSDKIVGNIDYFEVETEENLVVELMSVSKSVIIPRKSCLLQVGKAVLFKLQKECTDLQSQFWSSYYPFFGSCW